MNAIFQQIAQELSVKPSQVAAFAELLADGATVPFIARYRKEATGSLDDQQLRQIDARLSYLRELTQRKQAILASIQEQDKLSDDLARRIEQASSKAELEELYLPFKPKRQTKGQKALQAGLGPLAEQLWQAPDQPPEQLASAFICDQYPDLAAVLTGARDILAEQLAEQAHILAPMRDWLWQEGLLHAQVLPKHENDPEAQKFADWFDHQERLTGLPSHRALALLRGRNQGYLTLSLQPKADDRQQAQQLAIGRLASLAGFQAKGRASDAWLSELLRYTWRVKIATYLETELLSRLQTKAEDDAIAVFSANLRDLLLSPPAGAKITLALDPGFRTGTKAVVLSQTGQLLAHTTIFPHAPQNQWQASLQQLANLCQTHQVELIGIGNGTASRETQKLVAELIKTQPSGLQSALVSESGASVYSASELASQEFPNLDVTYRGSVSIGRRLQDPLAELVKIDPKAIGVGQYQHDLNAVKLRQSLDYVVEDCVNAVGVELNQASSHLLSRVAGLSPALAQNIIDFRQTIGQFNDRKQLLKVPRLGPKAFEQCAGFLRIQAGKNPLDNSAVHPEAYPLVDHILQRLKLPLNQLIGNTQALKSIDAQSLVNDRFGQVTIADVLTELAKPGRDPRPAFVSARFAEGVDKISDLKPGMRLEGVVSNVTDFGAFVDLGVHQDGLVHISMLSDDFVKDPRTQVRAGQVVKVWVLAVDVARKRISLSMKSQYQPSNDSGELPSRSSGTPSAQRPGQNGTKPAQAGAMAQQLAALLQKNKS